MLATAVPRRRRRRGAAGRVLETGRPLKASPDGCAAVDVDPGSGGRPRLRPRREFIAIGVDHALRSTPLPSGYPGWPPLSYVDFLTARVAHDFDGAARHSARNRSSPDQERSGSVRRTGSAGSRLFACGAMKACMMLASACSCQSARAPRRAGSLATETRSEFVGNTGLPRVPTGHARSPASSGRGSACSRRGSRTGVPRMSTPAIAMATRVPVAKVPQPGHSSRRRLSGT